MSRRSTGLMVALFASVILMAGFIPAQSTLTSGAWRLISPTEYTTYPGANLHGVYMLNGGTSGKGSGNGYAVGDRGLVFQWDGFSWNQAVSVASGCQLNSVNFGGPLNPLTSITSNAGWIVGGNNAGGGPCGQGESLFFNGVNWVEYTVPSAAPATTELRGVFLVQGGSTGAYIQAYAAGTESGANGAFWVWNGVPGSGGAWSRCSDAGCGGLFAAPLNSLYMTHCTGSPCAADDGIAVGNGGEIFRFVAGVWTARASPVVQNLNGVAMSSQTNGWAVGDACTIIHTTDGDNWSGAVSPGTCTANLRSIVMVSNSEAWAVGDADASGYPTVVHGTSLDSSPTWTRIPVNQVAVAGLTPAGQGLNSVIFATSGGNIWSVGAAGIAAFCLNNCNSAAGAIWSTTTSPQTETLRSVSMYSDSDGFAVGDVDTAGNPTIIRWNGGTYSWTRAPYVAPLVNPSSLYDVYMSGGSSGWAVGGTGTVASALYYDGNTWTGKPVPACGAGCYLKGVYMISDSNAWAVGTAGVIMHSTSTGGPFVISPSTVVTGELRDVAFDPTSGGQSGWAVGTDGANPVIVHTSNGGADAWPIVASPAAAGVTLTSAFFQDSTHGWATGTGGGTTTLLYWNGVSWTLVPVTINGPFTGPLDLERVWVLGGPPAQEGWAVGTDTGTVRPVTVHYDGSSWETMAPSEPTPGSLLGLTLRSGTNGLAVGTNLGAGTLALIYHLDPPGGVTATGNGGGGGATTSTPTTTSTSTSLTTSTTSSTSSSTSSATSSSTSTSTSQVSSSTSQTSTSTTSGQVASSTTSSTGSSVSTVTVTASSSSSQTTPLVVPAVPGFPLESIVAGVIIGLSVLVILRQRRRPTAT